MEPGERLGVFEVLGRLGAGGMGEVYRARDTRLGREVALKTLPAFFAEDPARLSRLRKEARILASLNHPHIATLLGLEESNGATVLVMELVEGQTLAERLRRGPLRLHQALDLARQIAEGLETAHEQGVLHRDLKPSNIAIDAKGQVKLLDFGLARMVPPEGPLKSEASTGTSPTSGLASIVGTAPYMSPEQARGEEVDRRTDVWAFGCVLYEMLTGKRAFPGGSWAETTAAVLEREPGWEALAGETPPAVRSLLQRCLHKDKGERLHDIADARLELKQVIGDPNSGVAAAAAREARRRRAAPWIAGLIAVALGAAAAGILFFRRVPPTRGSGIRLTLVPPRGARLRTNMASFQHLALSPAGDRVAYVAGSSANEFRLYLHTANELEAHPIPGTDNANSPFFSPDGRWLGFVQHGELRKLLLGEESPVTISGFPAWGVRGASWGSDGTIVFSMGLDQGLWEVPADGGTPRPLTQPDREKGELNHRWPQVLPGGRAVLFTALAASALAEDSRIEAVTRATGKRRVLVEGAGYARYLPGGYLVYARLGTLLAARFDLDHLRVEGPAVPVLEDVQMECAGHLYADFEISGTGAAAYVPGFPRPVESTLMWVDREGKAEPASRRKAAYERPRLSPDARDVVVDVQGDPCAWDLWRLDLARDTWTRLTSDGRSGDPEWSPDGSSVALSTSGPKGQELRQVSVGGDGASEQLGASPLAVVPNAYSPDGTSLLFTQERPETGWDLGILPFGGKARFLLATPSTECCATLSPDSRWMAYVSDETGSYEVYVTSFPDLRSKHVISTGTGGQPLWSRDGHELFYRSFGERPKLMAVVVHTKGGFHAGQPHPLFDDVFAERIGHTPALYDVAPDGQRFLFVEQPAETPAPSKLVLIPDFASEVERKLREAGEQGSQ